MVRNEISNSTDVKARLWFYVNCSSVAGLVGFTGIPAYTASKHGVIGVINWSENGSKMDQKRNLILNLIVSLLFLLPGLATAAKSADLIFLPGNTIRIDGDSTMKKYSAIADTFDLSGKANTNSANAASLLPAVVEMSLPVKNLKSGNGTLDKHMHENLKAEQFPEITMKLTEFKFSDDRSVISKGSLTVAGVTKPIVLKSVISKNLENTRIAGTYHLLMSDFGITPPRMMMGALKTKDEVRVSFDVGIAKNENQKDVK